MRDVLLQDFSDVDNVEVITTYDIRLPKPESASQAIVIDIGANAEMVWQQLLTDCDAVLIVAPETSGVLTKLTRMIEAANIRNLGSQTQAVAITSNKYETHQLLINANIATIPTYRAVEVVANNIEPTSSDGFILKPNDGAGCETTYYFADKEVLFAWLATYSPDNLIIQPYQRGRAASISVLFKQGQAWVLSCNEQLIEILAEDNHVHLKGCRVNALQQYLPALSKLASKIATAIPTLNGYAGIDVLIDQDNIYVVEINPRITTSYIGLRESLGYNPAQLIIDLVLNPTFDLPSDMQKNIMDIHLNA